MTSGLRKVTDDMKSKNQADRTGHVAAPPRPAGSAAAPANGPKPAKPSTVPPGWADLASQAPAVPAVTLDLHTHQACCPLLVIA